MSLLGSLDIGKRAMMNQTQSLKITGENISNVSTPGYSRKRIEVKNSIYTEQRDLNFLESRRIRDKFIDKSIRNENQNLGNWEMKSQLYGQIERIFLEPSENGINNLLIEFWNSWEELANNPENMTARAVVIQRGISLAQNINRIDSALKDIRKTSNNYINDKLDQLNQKASQIANYNARIQSVEASGGEASNLRDKRDMLIDDLSKLINISTVERDNGTIAVFIGGRAIVDDNVFTPIKADNISSKGMTVADLKWSDDSSKVEINNGEIAGLIQIRDEIIPELTEKLDKMSQTLINSVNKIHNAGYGLDGINGRDFFSGTNASDIKVNDDDLTGIVGHPERIAASQNGNVGNNQIALDIAKLSEIRVLLDGTITDTGDSINISRFYSETVNSLGTDIKLSNMMLDSVKLIVTDLEERKESVSGVSLDEEMTQLIRLQKAYESAAKYMSVINEMLDTLMRIGG
ncbi:MAG: flagellar hook-associated protein FlgK [Candidatus Poribacteria bacterium]